MEVCRSSGENRSQMKRILALIIKGWWQKTDELSVPAVTVELSWKQEISLWRKSDRKAVLLQLASYIHGRYLLKTWRNGVKACLVDRHDLMSRRNCNSLRNCVFILSLVVVGVPKSGSFDFFPMTNLRYVNISAWKPEATSAAMTAEGKWETLLTYSFCFLFCSMKSLHHSWLSKEYRFSIFTAR